MIGYTALPKDEDLRDEVSDIAESTDQEGESTEEEIETEDEQADDVENQIEGKENPNPPNGKENGKKVKKKISRGHIVHRKGNEYYPSSLSSSKNGNLFSSLTDFSISIGWILAIFSLIISLIIIPSILSTYIPSFSLVASSFSPSLPLQIQTLAQTYLIPSSVAASPNGLVSRLFPYSVRPSSPFMTSGIFLCQPNFQFNSSAIYDPAPNNFPNDFHSIALPSYFKTIGRLVFWEADVDEEESTIKLPLIQEKLDGDCYINSFVNDDTYGWTMKMANSHRITCTTQYADGHIMMRYATLFSSSYPEASRVPHIVCPFQPYRNIQSLTLTFHKSNGTHAPEDENEQYQSSMTMPLCVNSLPRVHISSIVKPLHGTYWIENVLEFYRYHRKIGVDHFYLYARDRTILTDIRIQQLVDRGTLTVLIFPLRRVPGKGLEITNDQYGINQVNYIRARKHAVWVMSQDKDEFLYLKKPPNGYYHRQCNNSLFCPSPLRDFLDKMSSYGFLQYAAWNVVGFPPPKEMWKGKDQERYGYPGAEEDRTRAIEAYTNPDYVSDHHINGTNPTHTKLPYVVRYVYKRPWLIKRPQPKWIYQTNKMVSAADTHGGATWARAWSNNNADSESADGDELTIYANHYTDLHAIRTMQPEEMEEFWKTAVIDTGVADLYTSLEDPVERSCVEEVCPLVPGIQYDL